jgi:hypothetical protein
VLIFRLVKERLHLQWKKNNRILLIITLDLIVDLKLLLLSRKSVLQINLEDTYNYSSFLPCAFFYLKIIYIFANILSFHWYQYYYTN